MSCCGDNWLVPGADPGGGSGGGVQSVGAGTPNVTITGTSTNPLINVSSTSIPRPSATIFVSPSGDDLTADGSIALPFQTIQGAINFRNTLSNTLNVEIYIYSGNYTGGINVTVGNTYFTGVSAPYREAKTVSIAGDVTVNITNLTGQGGCEVSFTNLLFTSTTLTTGSSVEQGLLITVTNCNITGACVHNQSTVTGIYNVRYADSLIFWNGALPCVRNVGCFLQIFRCEITHSASTLNPIINMQNGGGGGAGNLNLQYTTIRSSTTNVISPQPIVRYENTSTTNNNAMLYNSLYFTSSAVDTGGNKCAIQFNQTGQVNFDIMGFNIFECDGANFGSPPQSIQKRNTGGVTIATYGQNFGGQLAHTLAPGITKTSVLTITS